jgi:hypothetical protein
MNTKKLLTISSATAVVLMAATSLSASAAALGVNASTSVSASAKLDTSAQAKADVAITARITALNDLKTRIDQMQKVSDSEKTSLNNNIDVSVTDMINLKAKIDADTDNVTLKADIQSITKSYRIYLLILPQGRITAAGDRIMTIVGLLNDLSTKLQTRIGQIQASSKDVTALDASLTDMNSKTSDANLQAQAAINELANLQPDNGDKTVFASNQAAIKDARSKIKTAIADLKTARQDAGSIVKTILATKITTSASTNTSTSATTNTGTPSTTTGQ